MSKTTIVEVPVLQIRVGDLVFIDGKCHVVLETEHGTLGDESYVDLTLSLDMTPQGLVHQGRRFDAKATISTMYTIEKKPVNKWWQFWKRS